MKEPKTIHQITWGTRERNKFIYETCERNKIDGKVARGIFARLGRKFQPPLTRERIRQIYRNEEALQKKGKVKCEQH
jgi:hypothetical protein